MLCEALNNFEDIIYASFSIAYVYVSCLMLLMIETVIVYGQLYFRREHLN